MTPTSQAASIAGKDETMTTTDQARLLPCPSGHERIEVGYDDEAEQHFVACVGRADCRWAQYASDEAEAIAAWNTREQQITDRPSGERELLERFIACRSPAGTINSIHGAVETGEGWSITALNKVLADVRILLATPRTAALDPHTLEEALIAIRDFECDDGDEVGAYYAVKLRAQLALKGGA